MSSNFFAYPLCSSSFFSTDFKRSSNLISLSREMSHWPTTEQTPVMMATIITSLNYILTSSP